MLDSYTSGVLMHPSSLPGSFSIGDLGPAARQYADSLQRSGQSWWQVLPINPVGPGESPYSTTCSLAGEELLISPHDLQSLGLIKSKLPKALLTSNKVNFRKARKEKSPLFAEAFEAFAKRSDLQKQMASWKQKQNWLEDYSLYRACAEHLKQCDWSLWPKDLKNREPKALENMKRSLKNEIAYIEFLQFLFALQWKALRTYASDRGIKFMGDLPIFVSHGSSDVWANQNLFCLRPDGSMKVVAGVPPDPFFADGQKWGNALYDWPKHQAQSFSWWCERFKSLLEAFDMVRIDHFIGFHHYWEIPADAPTAKTGRWVRTPGKELFQALKASLGSIPMIAEDLGSVTPEVWALRDQFEIPGMRVLQFGFYGDEGSLYHNPSRYVASCVAYGGTHDNNTISGWYDDIKKDRKRKVMFRQLEQLLGKNGKEAAQTMLRLSLECTAKLVINQMQDILYLDGKHRMNVPGTPTGNWCWRMNPKAFTKAKEQEWALLTEASGRHLR